jgi:hypothetical protein
VRDMCVGPQALQGGSPGCPGAEMGGILLEALSWGSAAASFMAEVEGVPSPVISEQLCAEARHRAARTRDAASRLSFGI